MTWQDYLEAQAILTQSPSFNGLLMALIEKSDPDNRKKLRRAFPSQYEEWEKRSAAPGGKLYPFERVQMTLRLGELGRERRRHAHPK
jgi:hypothetical protein